ncbi:unnamed protein product [Leptosia nina]|uniref:Uncharacterized protein n=1 Tax=Leptosia nina TaxID=320188 RepID=A0AAV1JM91_9NEOP
MSFITKRERVFNECDLYDLPSRNEGKLKAYASCTDARAWSHFCTDKTEHLVDIIKRNNETCRPKYIPTDVIVNTLMVTKNVEISRLKRKIEEFEQMLAAYDHLELTYDQKCDIANAHAAIRAASKELDEMCLDLDLSGFTEGIDSERFVTGKSRGHETIRSIADEWESTKAKQETKSNQIGQGEISHTRDASTSASDTRLDDLQETIIRKDAKLNAMQNKIAIAGKDIRGLGVKGKIIFKMKVLEKFCLALIAPCSQEYEKAPSVQECSCYRAEVITTYALTSAETETKINIDDRRAQLVADIIDNDEMKEILSKDNIIIEKSNPEQVGENLLDTDGSGPENLNRLKSLQANFDELVNCYENLKYEKDCLFIRCQKYVELEKECECMQDRLREYNQLWSEKEYYRKRSEDLDILKERYYILTDEATNVEAKLKAECEINKIKCQNISYLQNENVALERKLQDVTLLSEKEKNSLNCKLKEYECKIMCQDQQIKSLSLQIDKFIEQGHEEIEHEGTSKSVELLDEIETQKEQIRNLRQALMCNEEEKQVLQDNFEEKLQIINDLKAAIEHWKEKCDKLLHSNICLEEYARDYQNQIEYLQDRNQLLSKELENKTEAFESLKEAMNSKSKEIHCLNNELEAKERKNIQLSEDIKINRNMYTKSIESFKNENEIAINTLKAKQRESREILDIIRQHLQNESEPNLNSFVERTDYSEHEEEKEIENSGLVNEINNLHNISIHSLHTLLDENVHYKETLDISRQKSENLERKLSDFQNLNQAFNELKNSYELLRSEKHTLEEELKLKNYELDDLINSFQLTKKESEELNQRLNETEDLKENFVKINVLYQKLVNERSVLQNDLKHTTVALENTKQYLDDCKQNNEQLILENRRLVDLERKLNSLKEDYENVTVEKQELMNNIANKNQEVNHAYCELENKTLENKNLSNKIEALQQKDINAENSISILKDDITLVRKESEEFKEKIMFLENIQAEFNNLKLTHQNMLLEKEKIEYEFEGLQKHLQQISEDNRQLTQHKLDLLSQLENLEKALINAQNALKESSKTPQVMLEELKIEIDTMKKEKIVNHKKIRELFDKLDESDALISNYQEDIINRDSKIATLQNYINKLEEEVARLNEDMALAVDSSEQILNNSRQRIDESLKILDAHHSKATHNMKMELTHLKNNNLYLENKLSTTKIKSEEHSQEKQKFIEQLNDLQSERRIILHNVKDLEVTCFENSSLNDDSCTLDDIITSLNRIRQCIEFKHSRSTSLEQKLLTVQNSSRLLLSKADEAKRIVENEKQKIIAEKEEAVKERLIMEKQLNVLETRLRDQISKDQDIIKDLDAKILNQKLMFEKIDEVRQDFITKLQDEIKNLEELYENSHSKMKDLQEKAFNLSEENSKKVEDVEIVTKNLEKKTKEVAYLRKCVDDLRNKPQQSSETQTMTFKKGDQTCQTDILKKVDQEIHNVALIKSDISKLPDTDRQFLREIKEHNENIKNNAELPLTYSNLDFIKRTYLNYKIKRLSPTKLEQCTISGNNSEESSGKIQEIEPVPETKTNVISDIGNHHKIIDIYNTHSIFTHNTGFSSKSPGVESIVDLSNDHFVNENRIEVKKQEKSKSIECSVHSTDNDLFLIYKDSDLDNSVSNAKNSWPNQHNSNFIVESKNLLLEKDKSSIKIFSGDIEQNYSASNQEDDSVKPKLTLSLPRVGTESFSGRTNLESDNKSVDSCTVAIYASPETQSDINLTDSQSNIEEITYNLPDNIILNKRGNHNIHRQKSGLPTENDFVNKEFEPNEHNNNIYKKKREKNYKQKNVKTLNSLNDEINMIKENYEVIKGNELPKDVFIGTDVTNKEQAPPEQSVMAKLDSSQEYENKIKELTVALDTIEKHYKMKIEAVKAQYDNNIKNIINEHNQGVESIQNLHEETLQDVIRSHENEIENLRTMSIEAMRKVELLERENNLLKMKIEYQNETREEPVKITADSRKRKHRRSESKMLTTTNIEAFNVRPKPRSHGPCTCTLDTNLSDTIRTIFEKVDDDQRRMGEQVYTKYIADKIVNGNVDALDVQELAFLHLKVCRTWKCKISKEEVLQKRIDCLESEVLNKQRLTKKHLADLDRKVAEERRRLEEVREAVCRNTPADSRDISPQSHPAVPEKDVCKCCSTSCNLELVEHLSAGDLAASRASSTLRPRRMKQESNRAVSAKLDLTERKEKKHYHEHEHPIRLRRSHDRTNKHKK